MPVSAMIDFLISLIYDDFNGMRQLSKYQLEYNEKMNNIVRFLSNHIERPDRENDPDCEATGKCPVR
jgi:hypothetical protein